MSIKLEELKAALKASGYPLYRNQAPKNTAYPYLVYSYISEEYKHSGNRIIATFAHYQISLFTAGIETDLLPIKKELDNRKIPFAGFSSIQGDENDDTITNFFTEVKVFQ